MDSATDDYICKGKFSTYSAEWMPKTDQVSIAIFCNALEEVGCPIRSAAPGTTLERIKSPTHEMLVNHMYEQLEKRAGLIRINGDAVIRTDVPWPSEDIDTPLDELLRDRPGQETEIKAMRLTGSHYGRCIAGKVDPVQLIFGDAEIRETMARSYRESEANTVLLSQLCDFIRAVAESWPTNRAPIRILEVGAGTGGTTSWMLPMLARSETPIVYTLTDIGPVFVNQAAEAFKEYPFAEYKILDIEQEPGPEFRNSQHIVLGTNVIHATLDICKSLKNIRKILRSDGFAVIGEMTAQTLWADVAFGLIAGFWRFSDGRRHALLNPQQWRKKFVSAGYGHVDWTKGRRPEAAMQGLIFALVSDPGYVYFSTEIS